jgi:hypothetical protein
MAASQSFASIIVCRLFIGLGESIFGQAVVLHYSLWVSTVQYIMYLTPR